MNTAEAKTARDKRRLLHKLFGDLGEIDEALKREHNYARRKELEAELAANDILREELLAGLGYQGLV